MKKKQTKSNDDCVGCVVYSKLKQEQYCIIYKERYENRCPCRFCLVKVGCRGLNNICEEFDRLIYICHQKEKYKRK